MNGSCLCGEVVFEIATLIEPFEFCHCTRCQKASGSAFAAFITAATNGYRIVRGEKSIRSYQAPVITQPPAYEVWFCSNCGSPVPEPHPEGDVFEIPAGTLDASVNVKPDKHIYIDCKSDWDDLAYNLPTFTGDEIKTFRAKHGRAASGQPSEDK